MCNQTNQIALNNNLFCLNKINWKRLQNALLLSANIFDRKVKVYPFIVCRWVTKNWQISTHYFDKMIKKLNALKTVEKSENFVSKLFPCIKQILWSI